MRLNPKVCILLAALVSVDSAAQDTIAIEEPSLPPLHEAIRAADIPAIRSLLQTGTDPNAVVFVEGTSITPLAFALQSPTDELADVVRLLLEAGADPNIKVDTPEVKLAPLVVALGRLDVARLLLEAGADPNVGMSAGPLVMPPLTLVLMDEGVTDAVGHVRLLLEAGADPNLPAEMDFEVLTPLQLSVESMSSAAVHVIRLLLDAGADPNEPFGLLTVALETGNSEVARLLREAGATEAPAEVEGARAREAVEGNAEEATADLSCDDETCFQERFSSCTAGTVFVTAEITDTQVRYEIIGVEDQGCRIAMTYIAIPNPGWEGEELTVTLSPTEPFLEEVRDAMSSCMSEDESRFNCDGPLSEILLLFGRP